MKKTFLFVMAVLLTAPLFAETFTVTKQVSEVASEFSWVPSTDVDNHSYVNFQLDKVVNVSCKSATNGVYWENTTDATLSDWRMYQAREKGEFNIRAAVGYQLKSITLTYTNKNDGVVGLVSGSSIATGNQVASDTKLKLGARVFSKTLYVGATSTKTNSQTRITKFSVEYESVPVDTLYLNTGGSGLWNQAGAKFSVWYWNDGEQGYFTDFLEPAYGETDIYRAIIPKSDSVIFVRHAATADVPTWDNKLHQTKGEKVNLEDNGNIMVVNGWEPADLEWDNYTPKQAPATPDMHDMLYFVGLNGNDTVRLNKYATTKNLAKLTATFEYSKDRINWSTYSWATSAEPTNTYQGAAIALAKGDSVFFRAKGTKGLNATMNNNASTRFTFAFGADDQIAAGGNIMSLYDATCEQDSMTTYGFYNLFNKANQLVSAPKLPAKKLAGDCYVNMFYGCSNLTAAPALPATTLANSCYNSMFRYCTALTQAPALPADTLANYCYSKMFNGCTSLTKAPELKATTLANLCYSNMFNGCTSLEVNSFSGSCDGAELVVPTVSGTAPTDWNWDMFTGCKGDAALTAEFGIQLGGHYCIKEYVDTLDYLYFVGLNGNDTVRLNKTGASLAATFEYSKDRKTWLDYTWPDNSGTGGYAIALENAGDTVFFRAKGTNGKNATMSTVGTYFQFSFGADDQIAAGGNIMSLYDATCEQDTMTEAGFNSLFKAAKQLVSVPKLPATKLASTCYKEMFTSCIALTAAPELPATILISYCYTSMFQNCTALTQAPDLKVTALAPLCCAQMFCNCTSLEVNSFSGSCDGAELVVPSTGAHYWNFYMFTGCKGDAALTAATGIQLGGHYCIKEYVPVIEGVSLTGFNDTYDGENHAVEVSGTEEGDKIEFSADSATWQSTNPSFKSVVDTLIYVRVQREKYIDWGGSAKITITPKRLTLGGQYVETKTYDGNTTATIILDELEGVVDGDDVTVSATGEFEDKNAGYTKEVSAVYTLSGNDVGNYYMDDYTETLPGDILVREIFLQSADLEKEYDGKALTAYSQTGGTTITDLTAGQTNNGYVDGECFTYSNFTGSQLIVGESDNTFDVSDSETALVSNYNITQEYGKLKVTAVPAEIYGRKVKNGDYGTICLPRQITYFEGAAGLYLPAYRDDDKLYCAPVSLTDVVAGQAYVFKANADSVSFTIDGTAVTQVVADNYIEGWLSDDFVMDQAFVAERENYYMLEDNQLWPIAEGKTMKKNFALFDMSIGTTTVAGATISISLGKSTGLVNANANVNASRKMMVNGQLLIIRNGKMFNAQGAAVE